MRELTKTSGQRALPVAMSTGLMFDLFAATGSIISVWTGKMCDHFDPNTTPILSGRSFLLDLLAAGLSGSLLATVGPTGRGRNNFGRCFSGGGGSPQQCFKPGSAGNRVRTGEQCARCGAYQPPIVSSADALSFELSSAYLASSFSFLFLMLIAWTILGVRPRPTRKLLSGHA